MAAGMGRRLRIGRALAGVVLAGAALSAAALSAAALAAAALGAASAGSAPIAVRTGQFESGGKPVEDFDCVPDSAGAHPAVIVLHGAVPRGAEDAPLAAMCRALAAAGYYAMFVEYYSQAGPANPGDPSASGRRFAPWANGNFAIWMREVASAVSTLENDPAVDRSRIALIGFSLGAFLAVATGATEGGRLAAVVEYYGGMPPGCARRAGNMPPTLIMHGADDRAVPVRYAHTLDAILTHYRRPHEMKIYPGVGHGFGIVTRGDSWRTTLGFLRRYFGK
jgi:carboxymethylenebutenolidase